MNKKKRRTKDEKKQKMKYMQTAKYAEKGMQSTELNCEIRVCAGNNKLYVGNNKM